MDIATKEGWRHYVDAVYEKPVLTSKAEVRAMGPAERALYNQARARYSQAGAFVKTPQFAEFQAAVRDRVYLNGYRLVGKLGLILSGEPGQGKTTTLLQIGKEHELRRRLMASEKNESTVPVVYVAVPAQAGARALLLEFVRFFGLPTRRGILYNELVEMVANAMRRCGTELVLVDDIHHLDLKFRSNIEASDMLKQLSERCGSTFVYAGIAVEGTGMLEGTREGQIRKRFELYDASPFSITTKQGRTDWGNLLLAMEDSLCLLDQSAGSILSGAKSLYWLTHGEIGPLKDLLQLAALHAIDDGSETLDLRRFDKEVERRQAAARSRQRG
ncbi:ATP-binding protein [uncultured Microbacterium sp.]|uniref:ATP-binding protein n=1 Tax=uncultured Microbacterium sp. TaxID=191216 RepID=UPI0028DBEEC6|nr:ATP-binding protein [uncultured Microbacterium sp.]